MFYYSDPLSGENIEVTDVSTAFYALKICSDNYFGIYHQGQEVAKELQRNAAEIYEQKFSLIEPYLPQPTDTSVTDTSVVITPPRIIPNPLPSTVPQNVIDAMNYLDEQYNIESQRLHAELNDDTSDLRASIERLENKVSAWFKDEVARRAAWLGGGRSVVLSGCTLQYSLGNVSFSYSELDY